MMDWLKSIRLRIHAVKSGATLLLAGDVSYSGLIFGLAKGSTWETGKQSLLGRGGLLSLGAGAQCFIGEGCKIGQRWTMKMVKAEQGALMKFGARCQIEDDVRFSTYGAGKISLGDDCFLGYGCIIAAHQNVSIGKNTAIAEYVSIRDHNHVVGGEGAVHLSTMAVNPTMIGEGVWIGAKVTIIAGVTIGDGAVVGANAVVTKDVSAHARVAGVPARPLA